jgi:outer membrane protein OmpA-like peptidoglycan-associated protein
MRAILLAMLAVGLMQSACSLRGSRAAATSETTVVLLTDDNGTTGVARISSPAGTTELSKPRETTVVIEKQAPGARRVMDDFEVDKVFGAALAAMPPPPLRVVLRFQFDSEDLTAQSRAELPELVRQVRDRPAPEVVVIGHTDTVGASAVNRQLGQRRADSVRRILVDAGINPDFIETLSHGEADLAVRTGDEISEPANRRVEITLR